MLASFVNWRKDIYTGHTENPKESPTLRNCSNQEERRRDRTLVYTVSVQTVTDGISRRVTQKSSGKHKFDTSLSRSQGYRMLLS